MGDGLLLALDPGYTHSAWVLLDRFGRLRGFAKEPNEKILPLIRLHAYKDIVIEFAQGMGQVAGKEMFVSCYWVGRFAEAAGGGVMGIHRKDVKLFLCGNLRAKDANVRGAILDLYGGKTVAIGNKKAPGPLYGLKADLWAALAVGLTYQAEGAGFPLPGFERGEGLGKN